MITTQNNLDHLAGRIEQAYRRRHPNWMATGLTPGVWTAAAVRLHEVATRQTAVPVDPELFVAVQSYKSFRRDPWRELTQIGASKAYQIAVRQIVRHLRSELATELRWANLYLRVTGTIDELISLHKAKASPIIKLMLCQQHNRSDLASIVQSAAEAQHLACPLYRMACKQILPGKLYPHPRLGLQQSIANQEQSFIWN